MKNNPFRPAFASELLHLLSVLELHPDIDAPVVEESIRTGRVNVSVLADRLLVVHTQGTSWSNSKRYLVELYSMALHPGVTSNVSELSEAYQLLAQHLRCDATVISTELHDRKAAVHRVVHGWGFQLLGSTFSRNTYGKDC